jgi:hypothetical protein
LNEESRSWLFAWGCVFCVVCIASVFAFELACSLCGLRSAVTFPAWWRLLALLIGALLLVDLCHRDTPLIYCACFDCCYHWQDYALLLWIACLATCVGTAHSCSWLFCSILASLSVSARMYP